MREQRVDGNLRAAELLRGAGLRATPQRLAIARQILARRHPTVGEVYEAVRVQFPTIGLATVYAALNAMSERGLARPLPFADAVRYDANTEPHANLICTACGRISDFEGVADLLHLMRQRTATQAEFELEHERVDLHGVCADCRGRRQPRPSRARR